MVKRHLSLQYLFYYQYLTMYENSEYRAYSLHFLLHRHLFLSAFISLLCNTLYGVLGCMLRIHIAHILRFRHAFYKYKYKYKCALVSVGIFIHANIFSCKLIINHLGCMRTRRIAHIRYTRYFDPSTNKFYWIDNVTKVSKVKHKIKNIALYQ